MSVPGKVAAAPYSLYFHCGDGNAERTALEWSVAMSSPHRRSARTDFDEVEHVTGYMSSESVLETSLHSLFLKQIQMLRESALARFKSATTSEAMPSGFTFSTADSLSSR
jgi:hypothetical protein